MKTFSTSTLQYTTICTAQLKTTSTLNVLWQQQLSTAITSCKKSHPHLNSKDNQITIWTRILAGACCSAQVRVYLPIWHKLLLQRTGGCEGLSVCLFPSPFKLRCVCMWLNWGPHIRNSLLLCPYLLFSLLLHTTHLSSSFSFLSIQQRFLG